MSLARNRSAARDVWMQAVGNGPSATRVTPDRVSSESTCEFSREKPGLPSAGLLFVCFEHGLPALIGTESRFGRFLSKRLEMADPLCQEPFGATTVS
jgi:hypothetical protein